jgi:ketosteroid isomerase-like protein
VTKVICAEDCGNSPKLLQLKRFLTAFAKGNDAFVLKNLTDDIAWHRPGSAPVQGKNGVGRLLEEMRRDPTAEMRIETIITHGPAGAANGTMRTAGGRTYAFCHVYHFNTAKDTRIKRLESYLIPV